MTYRLTAAGRRAALVQLLLLLLGVGGLLWAMAATLDLSLAAPLASWRAARPTWSVGQGLPVGGLMLALVALLLLGIQLLAAWSIRYRVSADALAIRVLGSDVVVAWSALRSVRPLQGLPQTHHAEIVLVAPLPRRLLLVLCNFRQTLPVYAAVADRGTFLATIRERIAQSEPSTR